MTTSFISATPTYDPEGNQVYKPSVGVVFKPAFENQHSYGGIVGALQDAILTQQGLPSAVKAYQTCLLYTSPSPRDRTRSRMPSSA